MEMPVEVTLWTALSNFVRVRCEFYGQFWRLVQTKTWPAPLYIERMQWAESTRPSAMLEDNLPPRPIRAEGFVEHGQLLRCCRLF